MNVNQKIADEMIGHGVDVQQYTNDVVRRMIALLNRADSDIAFALAQALDGMGSSGFSIERLDGLLSSVRALNDAAYASVYGDLSGELRVFTEYEAGYQMQLFSFAIPPQVVATVGVAAVDVERVYSAAMARPFQGRLLREWMQSLPADRALRVRDSVRMGYIQQESVSEIVKRVRGTKAKGYKDGILEIDRRHAEAVVRTAISHTAAFTKERFYEQNANLIASQIWSATLDTKTSEICRPRDGKKYQAVSPYKPIGHSFPWLGGPGRAHWNCRSVATPVTKSWKDLGLADIEEFSGSTRASMDGQVPAEKTYGKWLKEQTAQRQDQILGPTRGALLRRGGLELESFYNDKGRYLSLEELRKRDSKAFTKASI